MNNSFCFHENTNTSQTDQRDKVVKQSKWICSISLWFPSRFNSFIAFVYTTFLLLCQWEESYRIECLWGVHNECYTNISMECLIQRWYWFHSISVRIWSEPLSFFSCRVIPLSHSLSSINRCRADELRKLVLPHKKAYTQQQSNWHKNSALRFVSIRPSLLIQRVSV